MARVRDYVQGVVREVYHREDEAGFRADGVDVIEGAARFADPHTLVVGDRRVTGDKILIATGASPHLPDIAGLSGVPYDTYRTIFDNDRLPEHLLVVGSGPIGCEIAQCYRRLGAEVTLVGETLLPRDEPETREALGRVFAREGVGRAEARASAVRRDGDAIVLTAGGQEIRGDRLLLATGRRPNVEGLDLDAAGVALGRKGIRVDRHLRTSQGHIYAAGDVVGGLQFTHLAGWQAFRAVRNALLVGSEDAVNGAVPWATFTQPEVAHVGLTESRAREAYAGVTVAIRRAGEMDRALCEDDREAFVKIVRDGRGRIVGATIVGERAGEAITELTMAIRMELSPQKLAGAIHVYPTYSDPVQQMLAAMAQSDILGGALGAVVRNRLGPGLTRGTGERPER